MADARFPDPIPGIIPFGTVSIFAGAPGVGKTAMMAEWFVRWRDGRTICGYETQKPTAFYYLASDRQWASHQQWFNAVGFPDIIHYSLADDPDFDLNELLQPFNSLALFHNALDKLAPPPGALVCTDPISPLFIAGNPNAARDVARSLLGISREAQRRHITMFGVAHFGKQHNDPRTKYTRPQDRIAGSGAFSGFSDTQLYLVDPEPDHPYHVLGWNPRHTRPQEFKFVRDPASGLFVPYDALTDEARAAEVLECIPVGDGVKRAVVATTAKERFGHSLSTVQRALTVLLDEKRVLRVKGRYIRPAHPTIH